MANIGIIISGVSAQAGIRKAKNNGGETERKSMAKRKIKRVEWRQRKSAASVAA